MKLKKKKHKEDPIFQFPTSCAVCKECYLIPVNGKPGTYCMFGGPFAGYANAKA